MIKKTAFLGVLAALMFTLMPETLARGGKVVVANRVSGTISVIDARSLEVEEIALPTPDDIPPEPMYVVYTPLLDRVFVGDRAHDDVIVLNGRDLSFIDRVPAAAGVFHMWASPLGFQLWVNNDIDKSISVLNGWTLESITTFSIPDDLIALGGKPHDVIVDWFGAYVTIVGLEGDNDYVVKYNRFSYQEVARAPVGKDPHVSLDLFSRELFVPAQNSNEVAILNRRDLSVREVLDIPGAHGAWMEKGSRRFFTTNLPGGGEDGLFVIRPRTGEVLGVVDTPFAVPHNIVGTKDRRRLFITHSGATADKVSVYRTGRGAPTLIGEVTTGLNPFGLAYVR